MKLSLKNKKNYLYIITYNNLYIIIYEQFFLIFLFINFINFNL